MPRRQELTRDRRREHCSRQEPVRPNRLPGLQTRDPSPEPVLVLAHYSRKRRCPSHQRRPEQLPGPEPVQEQSQALAQQLTRHPRGHYLMRVWLILWYPRRCLRRWDPELPNCCRHRTMHHHWCPVRRQEP